jgi:hypothetical protein
VLRDAVTGYERLLEQVDRGERPLHRPREWEAAARRRKKVLARAAWHRPADTVAFIPATPGGELAERLRAVLQEEGARLNLNIRTVEAGGVSLKRKLTGGDLRAGEPCGQPGCRLCASGTEGGCHRKAGVVYKGTCTLCAQQDITAVYFGESGFSAYYRSNVHASEIQSKDLQNAFAKHLNIFHPEYEGDPTVFNTQVIQTFRKPLPRQITEATLIHNNNAQVKMNSKAEFRQPAVPRITATREPPGGDQQHQHQQLARGGRRGRGRVQGGGS